MGFMVHGGFLHADDIRTLATSEASLKAQIALVDEFARSNFRKLNVSKCGVVVFDRDRRAVLPTCEVDGSVLPAGDMGKCLGYWWKGDLLVTCAVEENIMKARRAFSSTMEVLVCFRETSALSHVIQCWRLV